MTRSANTALKKTASDTYSIRVLHLAVDGRIFGFGMTEELSRRRYGSSKAPLVYYVFDVLISSGRNLMDEPLTSAVWCWNATFCRE